MIFFLLPALNEAESLAQTVQGIHSQMKKIEKEYQIIVCDNGSIDNTPNIAKKNNAIVTHQSVKGYGYTVMKGIEYIQENFSTLPDREKILIFMDADGQDSEENIGLHLQNMNEVEFSIGSRIKNEELKIKNVNADKNATSFLHSWVNKLFGFLLWLRTGETFSDLGPFRALRMDTFLSLEMKELTYGWTAEMQKKIAQNNISYIEFYSAPKSRTAGDSKVSGADVWKQMKIGLQIIFVILK